MVEYQYSGIKFHMIPQTILNYAHSLSSKNLENTKMNNQEFHGFWLMWNNPPKINL